MKLNYLVALMGAAELASAHYFFENVMINGSP
jgi:hypothetical protein